MNLKLKKVEGTAGPAAPPPPSLLLDLLAAAGAALAGVLLPAALPVPAPDLAFLLVLLLPGVAVCLLAPLPGPTALVTQALPCRSTLGAWRLLHPGAAPG